VELHNAARCQGDVIDRNTAVALAVSKQAALAASKQTSGSANNMMSDCEVFHLGEKWPSVIVGNFPIV
jgi:hypothetical protein